MKFRRKFWFMVFIGLMVVSGGAVIFFTGPTVVFKENVVFSSSGNPIRTLYVLPVFSSPPQDQSHPAVVAIPPYTIPPVMMETSCIEFARRGVACAIPNFLGKTREESRQRMGKDSLRVMTLDVVSIVESLRAMPWVDPERVGTYGHSVGGTVAFLAGLEDPRIRAVVLIGMETEVYPQRPQNLLLLSGLYDELRTPAAFLKRFQEHGVSSNPEINTLYGNFAQGTARQITIIPTSEHFIEPFDPLLIRQLLQWYALAFDLPEVGQGTFREWWRQVMAFVFMLSATLVYTLLMIRVFSGISPKLRAKFPSWLVLRMQCVPLLILVVILWFSGSTMAGFRSLAADLMVSLLFAHVVISFWIERELETGQPPGFRALRCASFVVLALGIALLLTWGIMSLPFYLRFPGMILWYPVFVINVSVLFPLQIWGRVVAWLFTDVIDGLVPHRVYIALFGFMVVFPTWPMRFLNWVAEGFIVSLRTRLKPSDKPKARRSPITIVLVILIWSIFVFLLYRRIAEGMLTLETAMLGGFFLLRVAILPLLITWLILRTRFFQQISGLNELKR